MSSRGEKLGGKRKKPDSSNVYIAHGLDRKAGAQIRASLAAVLRFRLNVAKVGKAGEIWPGSSEWGRVWSEVCQIWTHWQRATRLARIWVEARFREQLSSHCSATSGRAKCTKGNVPRCARKRLSGHFGTPAILAATVGLSRAAGISKLSPRGQVDVGGGLGPNTAELGTCRNLQCFPDFPMRPKRQKDCRNPSGVGKRRIKNSLVDSCRCWKRPCSGQACDK